MLYYTPMDVLREFGSVFKKAITEVIQRYDAYYFESIPKYQIGEEVYIPRRDENGTIIDRALLYEIGAELGNATLGTKVQQVSVAIRNEIKDWKLWKNTCDWMKKNILDNVKAFTDNARKRGTYGNSRTNR